MPELQGIYWTRYHGVAVCEWEPVSLHGPTDGDDPRVIVASIGNDQDSWLSLVDGKLYATATPTKDSGYYEIGPKIELPA